MADIATVDCWKNTPPISFPSCVGKAPVILWPFSSTVLSSPVGSRGSKSYTYLWIPGEVSRVLLQKWQDCPLTCYATFAPSGPRSFMSQQAETLILWNLFVDNCIGHFPGRYPALSQCYSCVIQPSVKIISWILSMVSCVVTVMGVIFQPLSAMIEIGSTLLHHVVRRCTLP